MGRHGFETEEKHKDDWTKDPDERSGREIRTKEHPLSNMNSDDLTLSINDRRPSLVAKVSVSQVQPPRPEASGLIRPLPLNEPITAPPRTAPHRTQPDDPAPNQPVASDEPSWSHP